ncbi:MAG: hypothetical protein JWP95_856 [Actinotalea sp.]|nr:hypothetical protein [Actinotalea sp.]
MHRPVIRAAVTALLSTAALLTAGCAPDGEARTETPASEATETDGASGAEDSVSVEVPDVTVLLLDTAQGNLLRAGLEAEVVDESGAPVTADDPTAWRVTEQDPADGTVERGSVVTLTVVPRD